MRAVITLDDDGPVISMDVYLEGGYTKTSNAHQTANMLVKHLDDMASIKSKGEPTWVEGDDAQWITSDVVAVPSHDDTKRRVNALADIAHKSIIEIAR